MHFHVQVEKEENDSTSTVQHRSLCLPPPPRLSQHIMLEATRTSHPPRRIHSFIRSECIYFLLSNKTCSAFNIYMAVNIKTISFFFSSSLCRRGVAGDAKNPRKNGKEKFSPFYCAVDVARVICLMFATIPLHSRAHSTGAHRTLQPATVSFCTPWSAM